MCWIGRKGKGGTKHIGGMPSIRRTANGGGNASRLCAAAADLEGWAKLFRKCEFESIDFRDQLPKVADEPGCGIYVDAPWFGAGKNYQCNFTDDCHKELSALLHRFVHATIVIRYDENHATRLYYSDSDWKYHETASRTQANTNINEVWITRRAA
jgi:site-specific DNA-adenine methylase